MKNPALLILLVGLHFTAAAQWVQIPDPAFVVKLTELYPACMDGDLLNVQCPEVVNATLLDVRNSGISELSGVEHFVNLQLLWCNNNTLISLPALPGQLTQLWCYNNALSELPELPGQLTHLLCYNNAITALPVLPGSLTQLSCFNNQLTALPELPTTLTELLCYGNDLAALPGLPGSLTNLRCSGNALTQLPELPASLMELNCGNNAISALPELPEALTLLGCTNNALSELPALPGSLVTLSCQGNTIAELPGLPASLMHLECNNNALTTLPALPGSLTELRCENNLLTALPALPGLLTLLYCNTNLLTSLPELPGSLTELNCNSNSLVALPALPGSLTSLRCYNNDLTCLPTLPQSLTNSSTTYFNIGLNPFTCLPNYVPAMSGAMNSQWLGYPLCDLTDVLNNPFGCSGFEGIAGTVFDDVDQNCLQEEPEPGVVNIPLKLLDDQGNQLALTTMLGNMLYNFVAGVGEYTVQLVTEDMPYQVSCALPGEQQDVVLTASEPGVSGVDFGVECPPGHDVGVQSVVSTGWVFPGQEHTLRIAAGDMSAWYGLQCAAGVSGTVTVQMDGPVSYVGPAPGALSPTVIGPLQFTYTIADFALVDISQDFHLQLQTDTTAQDGDEVCVNVLVEPLAGDNNPGNNTYNQCYPVVNSYDPNIKEVWPGNVEPGFDGFFTYTIYFQNTGNAPAFNVRLADTLDTNLDLNTFAVSSYSHDVSTYLSGNALTFRFNNIMLPDSTSDPEGSIGYVQYRIKPLPGLPVGTVIENTAHIFFDFNEAIVTNTTQNLFTTTTGIDDIATLGLRVFPNPGNGVYQVSLNAGFAGTTMLEVFDLSGNRVAEQRVDGAFSILDLSGHSTGLYFVRVWNALGNAVVKVVKQ